MKQWKISFSTRLKAELLRLKLQRTSDDPDEPLFASASVNLRKVWESARKEAGIASVRFHDLRHTFATRMADAGYSNCFCFHQAKLVMEKPRRYLDESIHH